MTELQEAATAQKHKHLSIKKLRICEMCGKEYKIAANNQRFCGSLHRKEGCSWIFHQQKDHEYGKQRRLKDPAAARERYRLWRIKNPEKQKAIEKRNYQQKKNKKLGTSL